MPRYVIERTFVDGLHIPLTDAGVRLVGKVNRQNAALGVNWVHSYVSDDNSRTYCVYDAPTPEAIRHAAERNGLPVNQITEVRVLDPFFYRP
jgi:hypothetical protein